VGDVGGRVVFDHVVTNTGEVPLRDASMSCDPNSELVEDEGQMFMEATVTGVGDTGAPGIIDPVPPSGEGRLDSFTFVNGITIAATPGRRKNVGRRPDRDGRPCVVLGRALRWLGRVRGGGAGDAGHR
jgi:hypothetical protein